MYGISRFMPRKLKICTKYKHSLPVLNSSQNKVLIHGNNIQNIENNRRYSSHSFYILKRSPSTFRNDCTSYRHKQAFRNASSLSTDVPKTPTKKKSRKWKYLLGLGGLLGGFFFYYTSEEEDDDDEDISSGLPIPSKLSDITKDWIESMLSEYESRNSKGAIVKVKSFQVGNALVAGEGLNSQLLKLDVYASVENVCGPGSVSSVREPGSVSNVRGPGSVSSDKEYHVMIKMRERSKAMIRAMNKFIGSEIKELSIYSEVIPELNKFTEVYGNEFRIKVPDFLYGKCTNKDSVLVMENAKSSGYIPHSSKNETDLNHAKVVIENIAKLHAVSYSYNKTNNFLDKYPCHKEDGIMNTFFCQFNTVAILNNLIKLLMLKDDKYSKELAVKIENSKANIDNKIKVAIRDNSSKTMMCLTHADCHNSNFLFKYGESIDGKKIIDDFQFIDWQFSHWNSPIIDLQYFIYICTTHEFRKAHLETLLEHYHSVFTQATTRMDTPASHWTYEEFRKEYGRLSGYGLMRGILVTQLILSKLFEVYQQGALEESSHSYPRIEVMNAKLFKHYWNQLFTSPAFEKLNLSTMSALLLYFLGREIVSESNPILNDRIYGLILDADEQGLFDDYDGDKTQT